MSVGTTLWTVVHATISTKINLQHLMFIHQFWHNRLFYTKVVNKISLSIPLSSPASSFPSLSLILSLFIACLMEQIMNRSCASREYVCESGFEYIIRHLQWYYHHCVWLVRIHSFRSRFRSNLYQIALVNSVESQFNLGFDLSTRWMWMRTFFCTKIRLAIVLVA